MQKLLPYAHMYTIIRGMSGKTGSTKINGAYLGIHRWVRRGTGALSVTQYVVILLLQAGARRYDYHGALNSHWAAS